MKHLVGIGVLVAVAFVLRFWLHPNLGFDIYVHDSYWGIPLGVVAFWFLIGTALTWLSVFAWTSVRRHS